MNNIPQDLIQEFAEQLGFSKLSPEKQLALAERLGPFLFRELVASTEALLSADEKAQAIASIENDKPEEVLMLLSKRVPNLRERLLELLPV